MRLKPEEIQVGDVFEENATIRWRIVELVDNRTVRINANEGVSASFSESIQSLRDFTSSIQESTAELCHTLRGVSILFNLSFIVNLSNCLTAPQYICISTEDPYSILM